MKKIFTLLFAVGIFAMAQAQPGTRDNRQINPQYNQQNDQRDFNKGYGNNNAFDRERDMQIARINQEYAYKIQRVNRSFFMGRFEKQRQIRMLEQQRQREISMVYAKYDRRGHSNRRY